MCRLSLAWVTSENSTSNSNADILRLNLLRWTLSCLLYCLQSRVLTAPVRGSTPTLCCSPLCCPTPTASLLSSANRFRTGPPSTASLASPSHFRIRRDFRSKSPLSGFAPKQTNESSALATHPHSATQIEIQIDHLILARVLRRSRDSQLKRKNVSHIELCLPDSPHSKIDRKLKDRWISRY